MSELRRSQGLHSVHEWTEASWAPWREQSMPEKVSQFLQVGQRLPDSKMYPQETGENG